MGKNKGFLFAVRHREILMTDLGLTIEGWKNQPPRIKSVANIGILTIKIAYFAFFRVWQSFC